MQSDDFSCFDHLVQVGQVVGLRHRTHVERAVDGGHTHQLAALLHRGCDLVNAGKPADASSGGSGGSGGGGGGGSGGVAPRTTTRVALGSAVASGAALGLIQANATDFANSEVVRIGHHAASSAAKRGRGASDVTLLDLTAAMEAVRPGSVTRDEAGREGAAGPAGEVDAMDMQGLSLTCAGPDLSRSATP